MIERGLQHLVGPAATLGAFTDAFSGFHRGCSAALTLLPESASEPERDLPFCVFVDVLDACTPTAMHNRLSGDAG